MSNFSMVKILGIELPSEDQVFNAIVQSRKAPMEQVDQLRSFLIEAVKRFLAACSAYENLDYKEDPEILLEHLLRLHEYNGGLLGLADSLHRRIKTRAYFAAGETVVDPATGKAKKPTETEKEYRAREESSDVEGTVRMLDERQRSLQEKMSIQRGKLLRR